jgi:glycogen synthase
LFCRAVLCALRILTEVQGEQVDVLHLHDWQTAWRSARIVRA